MKETALWLAAHLPRLPLQALTDIHAELAVIATGGGRRWIVAAADQRLAPGTDLGLAQALRPAVIAVPRNPNAERAALMALACRAYAYSDRITWEQIGPERAYAVPRTTLWLEIGASLKLFGGVEALRQRVAAAFSESGYDAVLGIAPTLEAAAALARGGGRPILHRSALRDGLAGLPLSALALPHQVAEWLLDSGVATLGALLALPRAELAQRVPAAVPNYLDRLLGQCDDPRRWFRPPPTYRRRLPLPIAIDTAEGLVFPLRRLLAEFAGYLAARDTGVQCFSLRIEHGHGAVTAMELSLGRPSRDASLLLQVLRERLGTVRLPAAVTALQLGAETFERPGAGQGDLFSYGDADRVQFNLDRLRARLGAAAIWQPRLADDHRPEHAWTAAVPGDRSPPLQPPPAPRPLWLLRRPQPLSRPPPIVGAVERIECGWWQHAEIRRDYFACRLPDGRHGWAYQDLNDGRLYLHGWFA